MDPRPHPRSGPRDADGPGERPPSPDPSWFRRLSERVLGRPAPEDEHERIRSDLVLAFGLGFIVFGVLILLALHFLIPLPEASRRLARITTPSLMLGLAASVLCLRVTGSTRISAQVTNLSVFLVIAISTAVHGGIHSPVLCVFPMLPMVSGILAGRRSAAFWSAITVAFLLGLDHAGRTGWFVAAPLDHAAYFPSLMANMAIACAAAAAAVILYETTNAHLRRSLEEERRKLRHEAGHDPLTDLPNRRLFEHLQDHALRRAVRTKQKVALVVVDLDDFKPINDDYGHASGDQVLRAVADRLRGFTRVTDSIARWGGDEFAILVELLASEHDARIFAERLHEELSLELEIEAGASVGVSASIGVALYPDHGETAAALLEAADEAMYTAKAAGGDRFHLFGDIGPR